MKDRYAKINIAITIIADNKKYMLFDKESRKNSLSKISKSREFSFSQMKNLNSSKRYKYKYFKITSLPDSTFYVQQTTDHKYNVLKRFKKHSLSYYYYNIPSNFDDPVNMNELADYSYNNIINSKIYDDDYVESKMILNNKGDYLL